MSDPSNPAPIGKAIAEIPLWMAILLALASGLSGEMLRASALIELSWRQIAAGLVGIAVFMAAFALAVHPYLSAALCIFSAMLGGDVASSLFERWAAKRAGVCEVPTRPAHRSDE